MTTLSLIKKVLMGVLMVSMLAGITLFVPTGQVYAAAQPQTGTPPAPGNDQQLAPQTDTTPEARLEKAFKAEVRVLQAQGNRLERVDQITQRVEKLIEWLKGKGINVDGLIKALDNFKESINQAVPFHNAAKDILTTHAGFDDQGKVTDVKAARQTVLEARKDLKEAHRLISQSFRHLINTAREFRNRAKQ